MLEKRFKILCQTFSSDEKLVNELWTEVEKCHCSPKRHYHTLTHLAQIYKELNSQLTIVMEFSIFYHDIIYDVLKDDNEENSAVFAQKSLQRLNVDETTIQKVTQLIEESKTHQPSSMHNALFLDADLAVLGTDTLTYSTYAKNVRKEYASYDDVSYNKGRAKVLKHFLEKDQIFISPYFHTKYEKQSRQNIIIEYNSLI